MLFYTVSQIISFYYILPYYVRDNITHTATNKVKDDVKADNQSFAFGIFMKNLTSGYCFLCVLRFAKNSEMQFIYRSTE
jgi:hypothetical protein